MLVLVLIVGAVTRDGGKRSAAVIETDRAVTTLQSLLDGVDHDTDLASCPFGTVRSIAGDVHDELPLSTDLTEATHLVVVGDEDAVGEVLCSARTPDDRLRIGEALYVYATPAPTGSYTDYLSKTLLTGAKVELADPVPHGGGTIYTWCVAADTSFKAGCGADWVAGDHRLVLGMQAAGSDVTAKQVDRGAAARARGARARLGGDAPTASSGPATSSGTSPPGTTAPRATTPPPTAATGGFGTIVRGSATTPAP